MSCYYWRCDHDTNNTAASITTNIIHPFASVLSAPLEALDPFGEVNEELLKKIEASANALHNACALTTTSAARTRPSPYCSAKNQTTSSRSQSRIQTPRRYRRRSCRPSSRLGRRNTCWWPRRAFGLTYSIWQHRRPRPCNLFGWPLHQRGRV